MVVVLLSTYNGEKYIREQINSILCQEGIDFKLLIRDDGSSDSTVSIINEYMENHVNRIFFSKGENVGFAMSFTKLLQLGYEMFPECDYFAFSDQDDVWLKEKLASAVEKLSLESDAIPVTYCSNTTLVRADLSVIGNCWNPQNVKLSKERSLVQSFATGCTMVFNREAVRVYITHIPEKIKVHDFYMYQLCSMLGKVIFDPESHILYRQHGNNQIGKKNLFKRWIDRFKYLGHCSEHILEKQNYYLLKALKDLLSPEDIYLISKIAFYRRNIFCRLSLLLDRKISYSKIENNTMFILKILFGGV